MKCSNDLYPEHNGKECACVDCRPVDYCLDNPCAECEGPVEKRCQPPEEDEEIS